MKPRRAEIIAIGDEITSGVRLDTNTQWISSNLEAIGIHVAFHTSVGDQIDDKVAVFRNATNRVDIVICTGGLGPTADDLTRQAIAKMANVELVKDEAVLKHIESMYRAYGRTMPPNNAAQAMFPAGSKIINNPEGSAPGIDFSSVNANGDEFRIFALPGVPVEMKQMWEQSVEQELRTLASDDSVIHHHTLHCFGSGESHIETLLPDLIRRGRDPQVGITASAATISLRISTRAESVEACMIKMQPTIETIRNILGELVFGENGIELAEVVVDLLRKQDRSLAIFDMGLNLAVANMIAKADPEKRTLKLAEISAYEPEKAQLSVSARDVALAIGPLNRNENAIKTGNSFYDVLVKDEHGEHATQFRFSGHSGWRELRAVKEVLNCLRLHLIRLE